MLIPSNNGVANSQTAKSEAKTATKKDDSVLDNPNPFLSNTVSVGASKIKVGIQTGRLSSQPPNLNKPTPGPRTIRKDDELINPHPLHSHRSSVVGTNKTGIKSGNLPPNLSQQSNLAAAKPAPARNANQGATAAKPKDTLTPKELQMGTAPDVFNTGATTQTTFRTEAASALRRNPTMTTESKLYAADRFAKRHLANIPDKPIAEVTFPKKSQRDAALILNEHKSKTQAFALVCRARVDGKETHTFVYQPPNQPGRSHHFLLDKGDSKSLHNMMIASRLYQEFDFGEGLLNTTLVTPDSHAREKTATVK